MRMNAFGANLPSVTSGGCTGSFAARTGRWKASRNPLARPPFRRLRRETLSELFSAIIIGGLLRLASRYRLLDGGADTDIGAAAADIAGHRGVDVGVIRIGRRRQQCRRR